MIDSCLYIFDLAQGESGIGTLIVMQDGNQFDIGEKSETDLPT